MATTSHPGNKGAGRGGRRGGFTLAELLAVLGIIALVGGLSAAGFQLARRSYGFAASAAQVEATIRAARNSAQITGVPTRAVIDAAQGEVTAYAFETVGEWGFEDEADGVVLGARRAPAALKGASLAEGHVGRGLQIGPGAYADCGALSLYDLRAGVHAEAWVRWTPSEPPVVGAAAGSGVPFPNAPRTPGARRRVETRSAGAPSDAGAVIMKDGSYFLGIGKDGSLEGAIGDYRVRTAPGVVVPERWTRVALRFDGEEVQVLADGIERPVSVEGAASGKDAPRPPSSIPRTLSPLLIGSPRAMEGVVDEVRLHGLVEPLRYQLGPRERILGWKKVIRFDRQGRLDPRFHEIAPRLILVADEEEIEPTGRTQAAIDYSVTFAEWTRRRGLSVVEGAEAAQEDNLLKRYPGARQVVIAVDLSGSLRSS